MFGVLEHVRLSICIGVAANLLGEAVAQVPVQDQRPVDAALRPAVIGPEAGISTGHPLTTAAALKVLLQGGNAFDAGAAALLAGGVLEQDLFSLGGEALVLVYPRSDGEVISIVGQGWAPEAADIEWYRSRDKTLEGYGLDPAVVPGAVHAALTVLERWGTMSFEAVSASAIEYAENGFPLRPSTAASIRRESEFISQWPSNQRYWLKPDGSFYEAGETLKLPTLAATLRRLVEAERSAAATGRAMRAISPARWSHSSKTMAHRSLSPTLQSFLPASRHPRKLPIEITQSTSTAL
jgi:gamma-glutamyltranspeptidase/glutathione hydrolase